MTKAAGILTVIESNIERNSRFKHNLDIVVG